MNDSAANLRKRAAGASALFQFKDEFRDFGTEGFVLSSWTKKTFDRALKELSNDINLHDIRLKTNELGIFKVKTLGFVHSEPSRSS